MNEKTPEKDQLLEDAKVYKRSSMDLQLMALPTLIGGVLLREINALKAALPSKPATWFSWGTNNKFTKAQPWALIALGGLSFIGALFCEKKARDKTYAAAVIDAKETAPEPIAAADTAPCGCAHVERYEQEKSAQETSRA